jgi:Tfp pilus assembly protein PilN
VKDFSFIKTTPVYIEIGHGLLKALKEEQRVELTLERGADGRLTPSCRETLVSGLRAFVNQKAFQPKSRAYCALNAAGVSLRVLALPATTKEQFEKVLRLQIEAEMPLSPDELAWGYVPLRAGVSGKRELLVAAVKKEVVADYASVLETCGLEGVFTVGALARNVLCPNSSEPYGLLEASGNRAEWVSFDKEAPQGLRVLATSAETPLADSVLKVMGRDWRGKKIYLSGAGSDTATELHRRLDGIELVTLSGGAAGSAAIEGMRRAVEQGAGPDLPWLENRVKAVTGKFNAAASPALKPWLMRAAVLLALILILPLAEALVLKPFLAKKLTKLKADKGRLATIDRELDFLQSLKLNQPPYLDALYVMAKAAPQGTRFDTLTMNRQGEVSMHGMMQNGQQVTDFRAKLIASGFFGNVAVEEQTPAPDRQHVSLRMTAHWKPIAERMALAIGPTAEEIQEAKTNHEGGASGGMPPGMSFPMPGRRISRPQMMTP